jgi:hypothetical protein
MHLREFDFPGGYGTPGGFNGLYSLTKVQRIVALSDRETRRILRLSVAVNVSLLASTESGSARLHSVSGVNGTSQATVWL